jgi:hypothetical protein
MCIRTQALPWLVLLFIVPATSLEPVIIRVPMLTALLDTVRGR